MMLCGSGFAQCSASMTISKLLRPYQPKHEAGTQETRAASQLCYRCVKPWMSHFDVHCLNLSKDHTPSGSPFTWGGFWLVCAHPGSQKPPSPT